MDHADLLIMLEISVILNKKRGTIVIRFTIIFLKMVNAYMAWTLLVRLQ